MKKGPEKGPGARCRIFQMRAVFAPTCIDGSKTVHIRPISSRITRISTTSPIPPLGP